MAYINDSRSAAKLLFDSKYQLFLNFTDHTDQTKNSILYLKDQLDNFVQIYPVQSFFNYLDVGCGFGNKTLSVIDAIQKYHPIKTVALDPSEQLLAIFKNEITNQNIDLICNTWDNYYPLVYFDFISSIHTFYYIDNWESAILKMMAALSKNGKLCIAIRTDDPVCKFRNYFFKKIHHNEKKEPSHDELCTLLKRLNIHYKIDYVDSLLNIEDCLRQNIKGKQLIEFILRQTYDKLTDVKDEIISYIKQTQKNGYLAQRDAYVWISN